MIKKQVVYVVYTEPEYEGGGSYMGTREIEYVFIDEKKAKKFCEDAEFYYAYETVEVYD